MTLYRVFPYDSDAAQTEPGGALFRPLGGRGRIDNSSRYRVLYAASEPECAIAELFGAYAVWHSAMLTCANGLPYALATLKLGDNLSLWNMNDAEHLLQLGLRPTDIIVRDRERTQAWALKIFEKGGYAGISWWSYYGPQWQACGLWDLTGLEIESITPLTVDSTIVQNAATTIVRSIV